MGGVSEEQAAERTIPLGRYRLTSHSGDIALELSGRVDATFEIRAFHGTFRSVLAPAGAIEEGRGEFTLGDGGARLRLETFSGTVSVERAD